MKKKINWKIIGIIVFISLLGYLSFRLYKLNNQYEREYEENKILITTLEGDIRDLKNRSKINRKSAFKTEEDLNLYLKKGKEVSDIQTQMVKDILADNSSKVNDASKKLNDYFSDINGFEVVTWYFLPSFKDVDIKWEFIGNKDFKGRMVPSQFICRDQKTNNILCRVTTEYDTENKTFTNSDKKDTTIGLENKNNLESDKPVKGSDSDSTRERSEGKND